MTIVLSVPVTFEISDGIQHVRYAQRMLGYYTEDLQAVSAYNNADKRTKDGKRYNAALKRYEAFKKELQDALIQLGKDVASCDLKDEDLKGLMEDVILHPENYKNYP